MVFLAVPACNGHTIMQLCKVAEMDLAVSCVATALCLVQCVLVHIMGWHSSLGAS